MTKVTKFKKGKNKQKLFVRNELKKLMSDQKVFEQKRHRIALAGATMSTTSVYTHITTGITQGLTDLSTRIGDGIKIHHIRMKGDVLIGDNTNIVRIVVFWWYSTSATAPTDTDLFDDTTSAITKLYGPLDWDRQAAKTANVKKFGVVYDAVHKLTAVNKTLISININKKYKQGKLVQYIAGSSTECLGGLYMMYMSDSSIATHPTFNLYGVITYSDN